MKHLLHKLNSLRLLTLLTLLLGVGGSQVWAETTIFSMSGIKSPKTDTGYEINEVTWTLKTDAGYLALDNGAIHAGSSNKTVSELSMTTAGISGTITSVVVNARNAASTTSNVSVSVGGTSYTVSSTSLTSASLTSDFDDYTFTGSSTGEIVVSLTQKSAKKALYLYSIEVTYENKTSTTLSLNKTSTTLTANGATETLTATVTPDGGDALENPSITWTSSDPTVAKVEEGVVTPLKEGSTTITASYAGDDTYAKSSSTCTVTVTDARTAVNLSDFTATNTTLIAGGSPSSTSTSATNDQPDWTAAYNYSSSNPDVATVDANGVIAAVAKGTATITCLLNVSPSDASYKAGTTTSKTIVITVNNPSHTVTFSSNGSTYGEPASVEVEEGASITLPAENPSVYGKSFRGWVTTPIAGTTNNTPDFVTSPVIMGTSNVTYYAVFADAVAGEQTTITDDMTRSTTGKTGTSYEAWSGKTITSNAVYAGTCAGGENKIQLNSGSPRGIVSTKSGGTVRKIAVNWASGNTNNRALDIYGSSTAYSGSSDLSDNSKKGTKLGSITFTTGATSGELSITGDYAYVGFYASSAIYMSKISIQWETTGPTTYKNYCTTVSDLPLAVVTLSTDAIEMTWGESGKTLTATATVDDKTIAEPITFTPSSPDLTIDGSGNISCDVPGNYTITASVAETDEHQAGQAICNVIVNKKDIKLAFTDAEVIKMDEELGYTQTVTGLPETYKGTITYAITSSSSEDAEIDENTGELTFINTGVIEITATAAETSLYNGKSATYTLYVKTTPTIKISNQNVAYGSTFTVDKNAITGGDITVTSGSTTIATVDGLTITPVAVGSTTITVATAESNTYVAGEETFTLTVTAPEASSTNTAKETIFYESFDNCDGPGGNDGIWSGTAGNSTAGYDNVWTKSGSLEGANKCLKMASGNNSGSITTPSITTTAGTTYTLTFKAGSWAGKSSTLSLSATGATMTPNPNNISLNNETFNDYEATFTAQGSSVTLTFSAEEKYQLFLDEVKITKPLTSTSVTTTGGLATYCYQYPLDLNGISGAKAYVVKEVDMEKGKEKVMLTQITGTIKGGVPFILKSNGDDATFEIPLADESTTVPAGNLLVGTLAPTFVAQTSGDDTNFAYSKSNKCFVKLGDAGNTVPANRAYLPVKLSGNNQAKSFALTFDNADGIARTQIEGGEERVYNLAGQRLQKAQRGVNIINGRKVLVK